MESRVKRESGIELLRIILCFFVVMNHTKDPAYYSDHRMINAVGCSIWYLCNSVFFMISGYFALSNKKMLQEGGIGRFYRRKVVTLLIPLVVYSAFYIVEERWAAGIPIFTMEGVKDYLSRLITDDISYQMWFAYQLIACLLFTPILSYAFHNMRKKDIKLMFILGLVFTELLVLLSDFGMGMSVSYPFIGWLYIFCMGWFAEEFFTTKQEKWVYIIGVLGLILTILAMYYLPVYNYANDYALPHLLFCLAVFVLFKRRVKIKNEVGSRVVAFVARYTYPIYLIHVLVIRRIQDSFLPFTAESPLVLQLLNAILTFVVSYIVAVAVDFILFKPVGLLINALKPNRAAQ